MRAFTQSQRKSVPLIRLPFWMLLLVVLLAYPAALPAGDSFFRTADSLSVPQLASDFAGTPAQINLAKDRLPASVSAEAPVAPRLPEPAHTCQAPRLPETAHLPLSIEPSTPSQPRSPPAS